MSERERLAVAVQRLEWLADAALASAPGVTYGNSLPARIPTFFPRAAPASTFRS
jgi:hypothetical protein